MNERRAKLLIPLTNIGVLVTYLGYGICYSTLGVTTFDKVVTILILLLSLISLALSLFRWKIRQLAEKGAVSSTIASLGLIAVNELVSEHFFSQWLAFMLSISLLIWIFSLLDDYVGDQNEHDE